MSKIIVQSQEIFNNTRLYISFSGKNKHDDWHEELDGIQNTKNLASSVYKLKMRTY